MWSVFSKPLAIYLGTRMVAICRADSLLHCEQVDGLAAGLVVLERELLLLPERKALLFLSGSLCRPVLVRVPDGLADNDERTLALDALIRSTAGVDNGAEVRMDHRENAASVVGATVSRNTLDAIHQSFGRTGTALRSVSPFWAEALRSSEAAHPGTGLLAIQDCDSITVIAGTTLTFTSIECTAPVTDADTAARVLGRAAYAADSGQYLSLIRARPNPPASARAEGPLSSLVECTA